MTCKKLHVRYDFGWSKASAAEMTPLASARSTVSAAAYSGDASKLFKSSIASQRRSVVSGIMACVSPTTICNCLSMEWSLLARTFSTSRLLSSSS